MKEYAGPKRCALCRSRLGWPKTLPGLIARVGLGALLKCHVCGHEMCALCGSSFRYRKLRRGKRPLVEVGCEHCGYARGVSNDYALVVRSRPPTGPRTRG